ncbi:MAG: transcriptional regulator with XRE-family HTH domain [Myxococcota bacterium]|jgi:transcriptional regulator with XRE-family HTH domain
MTTPRDESMTAGLGKRIRTARQSMGWSLARLAEQASISKGYLWQLENERNANPSMEVLLRIADALDSTIAMLLGKAGVRAHLETPILEDLHHSLQAFLSERRRIGRPIPPADVRVLHSIQCRGEHPQTKEDWEVMLSVIQRLAAA